MVRSANVTRQEIVLGSRDSDTGWREQSFTAHTITALRFPRGASFTIQGVGVYSREDQMFLTADPVNQYDHLYTTPDERSYEVKTSQLHMHLDNFLFRELQCTYLQLFEEVPSEVTWSKTRPRDPRYRSKLFLDTRLRPAQITKNDDVTQAAWAVVYAEPPYPLALEFRATSDAVQGLYAVGQPTSSIALPSCDNSVYAYIDTVPILVAAIDSEGCNGDALHQKMVAEVKYVLETYAEGSFREQSDIIPATVQLGSTTVYQSIVVMDYTRDNTT